MVLFWDTKGCKRIVEICANENDQCTSKSEHEICQASNFALTSTRAIKRSPPLKCKIERKRSDTSGPQRPSEYSGELKFQNYGRRIMDWVKIVFFL